MDLNKVEILAVEMAAMEVLDESVKQLTDLELVLVGGGTGDVIIG